MPHLCVAYRGKAKHTNTFPFTSTSFWFKVVPLSLLISFLQSVLVLLNFKCTFIRIQNGLPLCIRFDSIKNCIQYHFYYLFAERKIFLSESFFTENSQRINVGHDYINSIQRTVDTKNASSFQFKYFTWILKILQKNTTKYQAKKNEILWITLLHWNCVTLRVR